MTESSGRRRYGPPNSRDPYADPATTPLPPPASGERSNGGGDWFAGAEAPRPADRPSAGPAARRPRPQRLPREPEPAWPQEEQPDEPPAPDQDTVDLNPARADATRRVPAAEATAGTDSGTDAGDAAEDTGGRVATEDEQPKGKSKKKGSFWKELPILIVVALVLTFLIQTFLARVYIIPSGSMEQTLHGCTGCTGDRILVDKVIFDFRDPEPGDVVVFRGPNGWARSEFTVENNDNAVVHWFKEFGAAIGLGPPQEYDLVKRVIAVGGQTISCCDRQNRVQVDGKSLDEPYVYWMPGTGGAAAQNNRFAPITVPPGKLFVMGDNRNNSDDSRFQNGGGVAGTVPVDNVIGKARFIIWPPGRWGGITDYNAQETANADGLHAPAWQQDVPLGVGFAAAWPVLWLGRRGRSAVRRAGARRNG